MEAFLDFFENMPVWQRFVWIIICLVFSWGLEAVIPLKNFSYKKWRHAGVNFVFLATNQQDDYRRFLPNFLPFLGKGLVE